jgi:hypothetical protein
MLFVTCQVGILVGPAFRGQASILSPFTESGRHGLALSGHLTKPSPGDGVDKHGLIA